MIKDKDALAIATDVCDRCRATLGDNLSSFVLYGSAVRGNRIPGRSDINVLIILQRSTPEAHQALAEQLKSTPLVTPFVLSRWELARTRQVFAMKFGSISRNYTVLFGEDPLADFAPPRKLLLFLCEQSLRNLRLRLEHAYIRNINTPSRYGQTLGRSITALLIALAEVLRCSGVQVPEDFNSRPEVIALHLGVDAAVLHKLLALRTDGQDLSASAAYELHANVFQLLSTAIDKVREQWPQAILIQ
jgi:predicted nucleotidyltransferase